MIINLRGRLWRLICTTALPLGFAVLVSLGLTVQGEESQSLLRTWKDKSGKFSVEATYLRVEDKKVVLKRSSDDKEISVAISKLNQEDQDFITSVTSVKPRDIYKDLDTTVELQWNSAPLSTVLNDSFPIPIWVNLKALNDTGVSMDSPVSISSKHSIGEALDQILHPLSCGWYVEGPVVVVSSMDDPKCASAVKLYKVHDSVSRFKSDTGYLRGIIQSIRNVNPDSWEESGAFGMIALIPGTQVFAVLQDETSHRRLAAECKTLIELVPPSSVSSKLLPLTFQNRINSKDREPKSLTEWFQSIAASLDTKLKLPKNGFANDSVTPQISLMGNPPQDISFQTAITLVCRNHGLSWSYSKNELQILEKVDLKNGQRKIDWKPSRKTAVNPNAIDLTVRRLFGESKGASQNSQNETGPSRKQLTFLYDFETILKVERLLNDIDAM